MRQFSKPISAVCGKDVAGVVSTLRTQAERPGEVILVNGVIDLGSCINCPDTPCVFFSDAEIASPLLSDFPFDHSRDVCPFDALTVDATQSIPVINAANCVGCGLCVSRCPANALHTSPNHIAVLNDKENSIFKKRSAPDPKAHEATVARLRAGMREGTARPLDTDTLDHVLNAVRGAARTNKKEKLLIRNLLLCLGAAISDERGRRHECPNRYVVEVEEYVLGDGSGL